MKDMTDKNTILIVEDDPFIAMDLEDTFDARGYKVLGPVADVDAGLKVLKETLPDIAMLDYNLGRETSIEIARALSKESIPYLFLSGQVTNVITDHDLPPQPVIAKPYVPEQLIQIVEDMIS
jgi:DNA-binding response OmpR family regulator